MEFTTIKIKVLKQKMCIKGSKEAGEACQPAVGSERGSYPFRHLPFTELVCFNPKSD